MFSILVKDHYPALAGEVFPLKENYKWGWTKKLNIINAVEHFALLSAGCTSVGMIDQGTGTGRSNLFKTSLGYAKNLFPNFNATL